jgi:hypothetical protein
VDRICIYMLSFCISKPSLNYCNFLILSRH